MGGGSDHANYWVSSVDPEKDWKEGLGWILSPPWLSGVAVVKAIGVGTIIKYVRPSIGIAVGIVAAAAFGLLLLIKRHRIKTLRSGYNFHAIAHSIRDEAFKLQVLGRQRREKEYVEKFSHFHNNASNRIAAYFRTTTGDDSINCAIRLAVYAKRKKRVYETVGRSHEMDQSRKDLTTSVDSREGIAGKLRNAKHLGVCVINDIAEAVRNGWWVRSATDDLPDVRRLMIAPINTYNVDGVRKHMLGILYVTSRHTPLKKASIEPIKAFADLLGMFYLTVTGSFRTKGDGEVVEEAEGPDEG